MKKRGLLWPATLALLIFGCGKEFLEEKTDKALLVPTSVSDMQMLLDNVLLMNAVPCLQLLSGDELRPTDNGWQAYTTPEQRNVYIWADDLYEGRASSDWNTPFQQILVANVVLEGVAKLRTMGNENQQTLTVLNASALFYRAMAYHYLTEKYARPYQIATAEDMPGIPYKLTADVNERPGRKSLAYTHAKMIEDLTEAAEWLPEKATVNCRPSKAAAYALLSRLYLIRQQYEEAVLYADKVLKINAQLVDFNIKTPYANATGNEEVIFNAGILSYNFLNSTLSYVGPSLISLYHANDLRMTYYFVSRGNNNYTLRPAIFSQNIGRFGGIATNEVYLIKAECLARKGLVNESLIELNKLLKTRYKTGSFTEYKNLTPKEALDIVLLERKKELVGRGLRWSDLRRLNLESDKAVVLTKEVKGVIYQLQPNANKYTFSIPATEVALSGIEQNER